MNIEDLKIGNLYNIGGVEKTLTFEDLYAFYEKYIGIKPIPLTEEKLVEFGFENSYLEGYGDALALFLDDFTIYMCEGDVYLELEYEFRKVKSCQYLHLLQNLVHSLTGEELTINN